MLFQKLLTSPKANDETKAGQFIQKKYQEAPVKERGSKTGKREKWERKAKKCQ